ncbi:MAG: DNA-binding protein [Blautia hansenii]
MDYMTLKKQVEHFTRQINYYCTENRIPGAVKMAGVWLLPKRQESIIRKILIISHANH